MDANGASKTVEEYINNVTPMKNLKTFYESFTNDDSPIDQPRTIVEKMDATAVETSVETEDAKVPSLAGQPFVCPVVGCYNQIKHERNIQRHIDSKHGIQQEDGTFAIIKYVCKAKKCKAKNIYFFKFYCTFRKVPFK